MIRPIASRQHKHHSGCRTAAVAAVVNFAVVSAAPNAAALQCGIPPDLSASASGPSAPAETVAPDSALPSSLVYYIHAQNYLQPEWAQNAIAWPLVEIAREERLSDHERFFLGQLYFMAFKPNEAYAIFEDFAHRDDWYGWLARQRLAIMDTRAFENFERLESNLKATRKNFAFDPEFASITGFAERALCQHWGAQGEHDRVVDFALDAMKSTPRDAAYRPLYMAGVCFESFEKTGRQDEAFDIADDIRRDLKTTLRKRDKTGGRRPIYDPNLYENVIEDRWYGRSKLAPYNYATYQIEQLIAYYDRFLSCRRDGEASACGAPEAGP